MIITTPLYVGNYQNVFLGEGVCIGPNASISALNAKFIKFYWTIDQILEHEEKLYPENERYSRAQLEEMFEKWGK